MAFAALLDRYVHIIRGYSWTICVPVLCSNAPRLGEGLNRSSVRRSYSRFHLWFDFCVRSSKGLDVGTLDFCGTRDHLRARHVDRTGKLVDMFVTDDQPVLSAQCGGAIPESYLKISARGFGARTAMTEALLGSQCEVIRR
jgi:hypothetical protein